MKEGEMIIAIVAVVLFVLEGSLVWFVFKAASDPDGEEVALLRSFPGKARNRDLFARFSEWARTHLD